MRDFIHSTQTIVVTARRCIVVRAQPVEMISLLSYALQICKVWFNGSTKLDNSYLGQCLDVFWITAKLPNIQICSLWVVICFRF